MRRVASRSEIPATNAEVGPGVRLLADEDGSAAVFQLLQGSMQGTTRFIHQVNRAFLATFMLKTKRARTIMCVDAGSETLEDLNWLLVSTSAFYAGKG
jgi:hypothetical protein